MYPERTYIYHEDNTFNNNLTPTVGTVSWLSRGFVLNSAASDAVHSTFNLNPQKKERACRVERQRHSGTETTLACFVVISIKQQQGETVENVSTMQSNILGHEARRSLLVWMMDYVLPFTSLPLILSFLLLETDQNIKVFSISRGFPSRISVFSARGDME